VRLVGYFGRTLEKAWRMLGHVRTGVDGLIPPRERGVDAHVGGVVNRRDSLAATQESLHRLALGVVVEDHAGGLEHHQHVEGGQIGGREHRRRVLRRDDLEVVGRRQLAEHSQAVGDGVVPEAGGLAEDESPERRGRLALRGRQRREYGRGHGQPGEDGFADGHANQLLGTDAPLRRARRRNG
jgi:hypothetical protein